MATDHTPGSYEYLLKGYEVEADGFGAIAESSLFPELLSRFANYQGFLSDRKKSISSRKLTQSLSGGTGIIEASNQDKILREVFFCSHIAACCALFEGWQIPLQSINREGMHIYAMRSLALYRDGDMDTIHPLIERIHKSDAIRTIQILRLLGLISIDYRSARQLSFAAGSGSRDIDGLHMTPVITHSNLPASRGREGEYITFQQEPRRPENIILVDNDPYYRKHYASLTSTNKDWLLALNDDADSVMEALATILDSNGMGKRNLVAGLRIDHRMLPDIDRFLSRLAPLIDQTADFIITVGAGHTVDEFEGRIRVLDELFHCLRARKLMPIRIKLHGSGNPEEQRSSPSFSITPYTTYEILYCKLKQKRL